MKKIFGIILLLISLCIIGYGTFLCLYNPKKIIIKSLSRGIYKINDIKYNINDFKISTSGSYTVNDDNYKIDGLSFFKNEKLLFSSNVSSKLNNQEVFSSNIVFNDEKLFLDFTNLINKKYLTIFKESGNYLDKKDILYFMNQFIKNFDLVLDDNNFSRKGEDVTINKVNYDSYKYTANISYEFLFEIFLNTFESIKKDDSQKSLNSFLFSQYDLSTYKSMLKKDIVGNNDENDIAVRLSFYFTKTNKPLGAEIIVNTNKNNSDKISLLFNMKNNSFSDFQILMQHNNKNYLELYYYNNDEITGYVFNNYFSGSYANNLDKKLDLSFYNIDDKSKEIGKLSYTFFDNDSKKDSFMFNYNNNNLDVSITLNNTISYDVSNNVSKIDNYNSIRYSELYNIIYSKIFD